MVRRIISKTSLTGILLTSIFATNNGFTATADQISRIVAGTEDQYSVTQLYYQGRGRVNQRLQIRKFATSHLAEAVQNTSTVFYPFGGPDAIYPSFFFPHMRTLILVGIENPGKLPATVEEAHVKVREVAQAYKDLLNRSFFITDEMKKEIREFGTTTLICAGLSAMGNTIVSATSNGSSATIEYRGNDGVPRTVYYFKQDLRNGGLKDGRFASYIRGLGTYTTFMKAASYLPQRPEFSDVNKLSLGARYVIQSGNGTPFHRFAKDGTWDIRLYGSYNGPTLKAPKQPDLQLAYNTRPTEGVVRYIGDHPFNMDYMSGKTLIYAIRRK